MQIFYTVRLGDTLYNIARRWNIPLISLINANNLKTPYTIYIGQQLSMPPGVRSYVVKPGESVFSISQSYGVPMNIIIEANPGLTSSIIPGMTIAIPYAPPGGIGNLAVLLNDNFQSYLGFYEPNTGKLNTMPINEVNETSNFNHKYLFGLLFYIFIIAPHFPY